MTLETDAPAGDGGTATVATDVAASTGNGAAAADSDWRAALDEDTRKTVDAKSWATPIDAVKGALKSHSDLHRELTEVKQKSLIRPGDDAKPEDWNAFREKMGVPKDPTYELKLPEGLPENFPYDQTSADKFKVWAHKAGLPPKEAQTLHDEYVRDTAAQLEAHQAAEAKAIVDATSSLVSGFGNPADAWGEQGSEGFKRNQELADRALRQQGGSELIAELKRDGYLSPEGAVKSPRLAMMLSRVGKALYAEDTLYGGINGAGPNPFADATVNMTKQGQIIRENPDRARALIRQAGVDPKEYGL